MNNLIKIAKSFENKLKVKAQDSSDAQKLANIFLNYENTSDILTMFLLSLDIFAQKSIDELNSNEPNVLKYIELRAKQYSLIESAINNISSEIHALDEIIANIDF